MSSSSSSSLSPDLPLDITIETLVAVVLVSIGLVLGAEKLKPITWSAWAGQIEREGGRKNPYRGLEQRIGFWDVRVSFDSLQSLLAVEACGFQLDECFWIDGINLVLTLSLPGKSKGIRRLDAQSRRVDFD